MWVLSALEVLKALLAASRGLKGLKARKGRVLQDLRASKVFPVLKESQGLKDLPRASRGLLVLKESQVLKALPVSQETRALQHLLAALRDLKDRKGQSALQGRWGLQDLLGQASQPRRIQP